MRMARNPEKVVASARTGGRMGDMKDARKKPPEKAEEKAGENSGASPGTAGNVPGAGTPDPPLSAYRRLLERLSAKRARFVEEYLIDLNPARAAVRAHYSERAADRQGWRLLRDAGVRAAVEAGKAEISRRLRINQDEVIKELALIGFADLADYVAWDETGRPAVKPSGALADGKSRAVESIRFETTAAGANKVTIKLHDKVRALQGILDRVKPADPPPTQKHEVSFTSFPPEPKTMAEWEKLVRGEHGLAKDGGRKEAP